MIDDSFSLARMNREKAIHDASMENPGPYMTLSQLYKVRKQLADAAGDITIHGAGEKKGGHQSRQFNEFYEKKDVNPSDVATGARRNHRKIVHKDIPELYMAEQLEKAGHAEYDIKDELARFRYELRTKYGGPENAKKRAFMRKTKMDAPEDL